MGTCCIILYHAAVGLRSLSADCYCMEVEMDTGFVLNGMDGVVCMRGMDGGEHVRYAGLLLYP